MSYKQWGSENSIRRTAEYSLTFPKAFFVVPVGGFGANGNFAGSYISDINDTISNLTYKIYKTDGSIFTGIATIKYIAIGW